MRHLSIDVELAEFAGVKQEEEEEEENSLTMKRLVMERWCSGDCDD